MGDLHALLDREARRVSASPEALEASIRPRNRPRSRRSRVVLVAALTLVAVSATVMVAVARSGNRAVIEIGAAAAIANPDAATRQLQEAGIDARIVSVPVGPNLQGRWLWFFFAPRVRVADSTWNSLGDAFDERSVLEVPIGLPGPVTFTIGRRPIGSEQAIEGLDPTNALGPGSSLFCLALERMTPKQAEVSLSALGYRSVWMFEGNSRADEVHAPPVGSVINWAWFRSPDLVDIRLSSRADSRAFREAEGTPTGSVDRTPFCS